MIGLLVRLLAAAGGDLRMQQVTGYLIIEHPIKMARRKVHLMRPNKNKLLSTKLLENVEGVDLFQLLELSLFGSR